MVARMGTSRGSTRSLAGAVAATAVLALCFTARSDAQNTTCPVTSSLRDFDFKRYLGRWWYSSRPNSAALNLGPRCPEVLYSLSETGEARFNLTYFDREGNFTSGTGIILNPCAPDGHLRHTTDGLPLDSVGVFAIVYTDYITFSIEVVCSFAEGRLSNTTWFATRKPDPSEAVMKAIYDAARNAKIDPATLKKTTCGNV